MYVHTLHLYQAKNVLRLLLHAELSIYIKTYVHDK